jgi:hypothetical protein
MEGKMNVKVEKLIKTEQFYGLQYNTSFGWILYKQDKTKDAVREMKIKAERYDPDVDFRLIERTIITTDKIIE